MALKRLLPQFAGDRQVRRRLLREGEIARGLDHPNIVRVLETGEADGSPFLVLELAGGEDLGQRLAREGRLSVEEAVRIARAVAQALGHAHARGIVHRDLKPQNVLLDGDAVKLTDFGLARVETFASLTGSSLLWGSPEYMAPELFLRGRADPRTDLYSLGVLLYEMLAGKLPWQEGRGRPWAGAATADTAWAPRAPGAGEALDRLVAALLSPSPMDRPSSVADVLFALNDNLPAPPVCLVPCPACDAPGPQDLPICFSCGGVGQTLRSAPNGAWRVVLRTITDDAESMASLDEVLSRLRGGVERIKFLSGSPRLYSADEQKFGIQLPVTLFANLDEATAKTIETMLTTRKLDARAIENRKLGRLARVSLKTVAIQLACTAGVLGYWWISKPFETVLVLIGIVALVAPPFVIRASKQRWRERAGVPRFTLPESVGPAPIAEGLLEAAQEVHGRFVSPDARALFGAVAQELYRLTQRAEEMAQIRSEGTSEEALARRLLALAPALGERLAGVAQRLESLDAALDGDSEGETARALAALDRREAAADAADRAAIADARRGLEAALDRRLAVEGERERLAAALCRMLATVRDLYRRAAGMTLADEHERAAFETQLRELASGDSSTTESPCPIRPLSGATRIGPPVRGS